MAGYSSFCQENSKSENDNFIFKLLSSQPELFGKFINNPEKYRLQIIYTQVDRDTNNHPGFKTYYFRNKPKEYFYPASTVKMPVSALVLEKLNNLSDKNISKDTRLIIEKSFNCEPEIDKDTASVNGYPTLGNYISKALIVSDNNSFNKLFEFPGQKYINKRIKQLGLKNTLVIHRFTYNKFKDNRHSNAFKFLNDTGKVIFYKPPEYNRKKYKKPFKDMKVGKGYLDDKGKLINKPMNFSGKNYFALNDMTEVLKRIVFPEAYNSENRFDLSETDRRFLLKQLASWPDESDIPALHDTTKYYRSITNYLFYGHDKNAAIDSNIRIFNVVGQAYGFLTDCAYIVDFSKNIEFFLSATIYVNNDEILNDDIYEYKTDGFTFMKNLGLFFYNYELKRTNTHIPDLKYFKNLFSEFKK